MPSRSEKKRWRKLQRRKGRAEHGLFLAEGPRLLEELLRSPVEVRAVVHTREAARDPALGELLGRVRSERGVRPEEVSERELERLSDAETPQGVLAVAAIPAWSRDRVEPGRVVILDGVQDPGNAGTLVRTAEAMALDAVLSLPGTVDLWNPKVVRGSAGSLFRLPVLEAGWEEAREWLRESGVEVWAADPGGEPLSRDGPVPERLALVLGNEGAGVREEVRAEAARLVAVELRGAVDSLNVAVAAAILMDRLFVPEPGRVPGPG